MDAKFISIIQKVISDRGKSVVNNRAVFNSLLADYARGEFYRERRLFIRELETKSIDELMAKYHLPKPASSLVPILPPVSPSVPIPPPIPTSPPPSNTPVIDDSDDDDDTEETVMRLLKKGWKCLGCEDYEKAERKFTKAIRIAPNCAPAYKGLGVVAANYGNYDAAIDLFEEAVDYFDEAGNNHEVRECRRFVKEIREQIASDTRRDAENEENFRKIVKNIFDIFS
jgi:tetratricopeptide (TPR) repeat protein